MATSEVHFKITDLPQFEAFTGAVAVLLRELADCPVLPVPVMEAADGVRQAVAALGGKDVGPPPEPSDEDRIRDALAEAEEYPGRIITR